MFFTIRVLETAAEINAIEDLQRGIWGNEGVAPGHVIITAAHNGGLAAGAYVGGELVGFVWGFLGWDERVHPPRLKHCSHMLGVLPQYRSAGIGEALKRFQYETVRRQGLELITWTYDPLLATNAQLNIHKLRAVCNTYLVDHYGGLGDGLNAALATDRFQVDWWLQPSLPGAQELRSGPAGILPANLGPTGQLEPPRDIEVLLGSSLVTYQIPADFQALKTADRALAQEWRRESRVAFQSLFAAGYIVRDFVRTAGRAFYVLYHEANHAY
jgi:chorismate synthase